MNVAHLSLQRYETLSKIPGEVKVKSPVSVAKNVIDSGIKIIELGA